ncbi:hypothetical protein HPB51_016038 [Rhipicephalus microplus]|uniref:Uncharacterized protein n=1 Tax=Rhipicephalus microplus TaxID=6941 RepID=A0A9J6DI10_RHIMP|nr:hypothetical protein HPB51_016038 [Rhipicephalus microplus]
MAGHFGFGELFDPKRPDEDPDGNESGNREDETFARLVRRLNNIVCQSEVKSLENPEAQLDPAEELHEYKAMMDVLTGDPMLLPTESNYLSLACAVLHNASKCTRLGLPVLLSHHRVLLEKVADMRSGPGWLAADLGRVRCSLAQRLLAEGDPRGCQRMLAPLMRWLHRPGNRALDWTGGRLRWLRAGDHVSLRSLAYLLAAQADFALKGSCCPALLCQVRCPLLGPRLAYFRALAVTDEKQLWTALQRWPRDAPLWTLAGCRLASRGRWRSALQLFMRALRLEEESVHAARSEQNGERGLALWNLAACLGALEQREAQGRALELLASRCCGPGRDAQLAVAAARALDGLNMHAEAARAYGGLVQRGCQGGQRSLRVDWALCLLRGGRPRASLQACGAVGTSGTDGGVDEDDPRLAFCRGSAMAALGEVEPALQEFRRGLALAAAAAGEEGGDWLRSQLLVNIAVLRAPREEETSRRQLARALAICPGEEAVVASTRAPMCNPSSLSRQITSTQRTT